MHPSPQDLQDSRLSHTPHATALQKDFGCLEEAPSSVNNGGGSVSPNGGKVTRLGGKLCD